MSERNAAAEYFFSLLDDAISVIKKDPLREVVPLYDYEVHEADDVKLHPSLQAAFEEEKESTEITGKEKTEVARNKTSALGYLELDSILADCHSCDAWFNRNELVTAGNGARHPIFMFVTDRVYADGAFLTAQENEFFSKWLDALHLDRRKECYFTSVIKCPMDGSWLPPGCEEILKRQIEVLQPKVLVMLGSAGCLIAANTIYIDDARKKTWTYEGLPTICTYSPGQVLGDYKNLRRPIWEDLKKAAEFAGTFDRIG